MLRGDAAAMSHSSPTAASADWRAVALQTVAVVLAWLVSLLGHLDNDGLWYRGDAARHALNGVFWSDLIAARPEQPRDYVLQYYARYPALALLTYPPAFHFAEAAAFRIFAPSAFVAKGLVLAFSLLACLGLAAWLRRYVATDAGWGAAWLALQPGVVVWSNAVMLNIPAMSVAVAALYAARRWIDAPSRLRFLLMLSFTGLLIVVYYPAALIVVVLAAWLLGDGRWRTAWTRHRPAVLVLGCVLLTCAFASLVVTPIPSLKLVSLEDLLHWSKWRYYLRAVPRLLHPVVVLLAAAALVSAVIDRRYRHEVRLLAIWVGIVYLGLTCLWPREPRYALLLVPAVVMLAVIGLRAVVELTHDTLSVGAARGHVVALLGVSAILAWSAYRTPVPAIAGIEEVARFAVHHAPTERILYDGRSDGTFIFYVRVHDAGFSRAVIRGSKLLYASALMPTWRLTERVASRADVLRALEHDCGCRWVVIERQSSDDGIAAMRFLREAVTGPEFRLVRSFPVTAPGTTQVDVYEYLGPLETPREIELPFPILGKRTLHRVRPIER